MMNQNQPVISYAQNFEDIMLWRALRHVTPGFYIDVGAQDPVVDSVSHLFSDFGWSGVHVEPHPRYADALRECHAGDLVIQAAVGAERGVLDFYPIDGTGISTMVLDIARQHEAQGFKVSHALTPVITLDDVFESAGRDEVQWLKIDVEGFEPQVLAGWTRSLLRPWVVVVESTLPMTQTSVFETWEPLLLAKEYQFVYADGLNRFYVSRQHLELVAAFSSPPNVFDGFRISGHASSPLHLEITSRFEQETKLLKQEHWQQRQALEQALQEARAEHADEVTGRATDNAFRNEPLKMAVEQLQEAVVQTQRDRDVVVGALQSQVSTLVAELENRRTEFDRREHLQAQVIDGLIRQAESVRAENQVANEAAQQQIEVLQQSLEEAQADWQKEVAHRDAAAKTKLDEALGLAHQAQAALDESERERRFVQEAHRLERDALSAAHLRTIDSQSRAEARIAEVLGLLHQAQAALDENERDRRSLQEAHRVERDALAAAHLRTVDSHSRREELQASAIRALEARLKAAQEASETLRADHRSKVAEQAARAQSALREALSAAESQRRQTVDSHRAREKRLLDLLDESAVRLRLLQDQAMQREAALMCRIETTAQERDIARQQHLLAVSAWTVKLAALEVRAEADRRAAAAELTGLHDAHTQDHAQAARTLEELSALHRSELAALSLAHQRSEREWQHALSESHVAFDNERASQEARRHAQDVELQRLARKLLRLQQHWLVRWMKIDASQR